LSSPCPWLLESLLEFLSGFQFNLKEKHVKLP
jgi:hypothetical protein